MNIFIAKLNFKIQNDDLKTIFETFGEVTSAKVIFDHFTGKSKGFAFVEMPNDNEGYAAINNLNESDLDGKTIIVKKAVPRDTKKLKRSIIDSPLVLNAMTENILKNKYGNSP